MPVNLQQEKRAVSTLASLYTLRMLGLFLVLPVMSLYGVNYTESTPMLIGIALGAYGATQAVLQIPLSVLSDRIGRRSIVIGGLAAFVLGSVVAAMSTSIYGLILGRALQGAGAISGTLMAMVSDLTSEQNRTKAMATIGASIGVSFAVAMLLGPVLAHWGGLSGIFWVTATLGAAGFALVFFVLPEPPAETVHALHRDTLPVPSLLWRVLSDSQLLRLNGGIFCLHMALMASFVVVPRLLEKQLGLDRSHHWEVYLPVLGGSFIAMIPLMVIAEKKRRVKEIFVLAVAVLVFALLFLGAAYQFNTGLLIGLFLFFFAFNLLEAQLPSLVSKLAPAGSRGSAMGIYSTSQFIGTFVGGTLGGLMLHLGEPRWLFWLLALPVMGWCWLAITMQPPQYLLNMMLRFTGDADAVREQLQNMTGVAQVLVVPEENMAYLKVDDAMLDRAALDRLRAPE
ncbi:MAG: MFS transporter [Pseudomonadales bacterium]